MEKEFLRACLAEGLSLDDIGRRVDRHPSTISYHLKRHGLAPVNAGRHANKGAIPEPLLARLIEEGLSLRELAQAVERSPSTVRYWVRKYGLATRGMGLQRPELKEAKERGLKRVNLGPSPLPR